jgi:uncharacterized protein (TIGR02646 family)
MIFVTRTAKPNVLINNAVQWLADLRAATTKDEREKAQEKYRHPEVRTALEEMFHHKCAFCESHITHVSYDDIEHFIPKSDEPDLTFEWENFLLACPKCNRAEKRTQFPRDASGKPLLINPTIDKPEEHLEFKWDEISTSANETYVISTVSGKDPQGNATEEILNLNRFLLRKHRNSYVRLLLALGKDAHKNSKDRDLLLLATQPQEEYSAFAIAIAKEFGVI